MKKEKEIGIPKSAPQSVKDKDAKMDKARGIQEGSPEDKKQDAKLMKEHHAKMEAKGFKKY